MGGFLAKVTVGMPVYNGGALFEKALLSVLNQSYREIVIFISDNCSGDETQNICEKHAAMDSRIIYHRQSENIGANRNFDFVMHSAKTEFFMYVAADDFISGNYVEDNLSFLLENKDYIASTCPVRFSTGETDSTVVGDATISGDDPYQRALSVLTYGNANGRFYSLYRREPVCAWVFNEQGFVGGDVLFVFAALLKGKMNRVDSGFIELGRDGMSTQADFYVRFSKTFVNYIAPFHEYALAVMALLKGAPLSVRAHAFKFFVILNLRTSAARLLAFLKMYRVSRSLKRKIVG